MPEAFTPNAAERLVQRPRVYMVLTITPLFIQPRRSRRATSVLLAVIAGIRGGLENAETDAWGDNGQPGNNSGRDRVRGLGGSRKEKADATGDENNKPGYREVPTTNALRRSKGVRTRPWLSLFRIIEVVFISVVACQLRHL